MANKVFDRVKVVTATTGTASLTLGAAVNGFRTWAAGGAADGDNVVYVIEDGYAFEIGWGQLGGTGTLLTRNLISSSTGALLNLSGNAVVYSGVIKQEWDAKADVNHNHDAAYQAKSTILGNVTASAGAGFIKRDAAGAITIDGSVYALASDVAANYQPKGSYALLTGAAFTGGISATSISTTGNIVATKDNAQTRYMLSAGDKGWRVIHGGTGVTGGSLTLQYSTDAFATNFVNGLVLDTAGNATILGTVTSAGRALVGLGADGGMEIGGYIDFHSPTADGVDYRARIQADASGSLFLDPTSDVMNVWATSLYLGAGTQNLLVQHDGSNGYIRSQANKGHLYLGANGANVLAIGSGGNVTLQQNGKGYGFMDASGSSPILQCQTDNNIVFCSTTSTGVSKPIWSVYARQDNPTFQVNTPVNIAGATVVNAGLTVSNGGWLVVNAAAGAQGVMTFARAGATRWALQLDSGAESGGNVSGNFYIGRYTDAGVWISNPFQIERATGKTTLDVGGNVSGANIALQVASGGSGGTHMNFVPKAGAGNWNPIVQDGDSLLWWTLNNTSGTGALVLGPWGASGNGLRIDGNGTLNCYSSNGNQLILKAGVASNPSLIMRNDGSTFYFLKSAASVNASGSWDTTRPFSISLANGNVTMAHDVTVGGNLYSNNTALVCNATNDMTLTTGAKRFRTGGGNIAGGDAAACLQVYNDINTGGAHMAFHRSGAYAVFMGLDSDNVLRIGGWSAPANVLQLAMDGNLTLQGTGAALNLKDRNASGGSYTLYVNAGSVRLWNGSDRWTLDGSGNMWVNGNITSASDARLKTNIRPIEQPEAVLQIDGKRFEKDGAEQIGFIAQQVQEHIPEAVTEGEDGMLRLNTVPILAELLEVVKRQGAKIAELEARLA